MAVFLRVHGDVVVGDDEVREAVEEYRDALEGERRRVERLGGSVSGLVGWLRAARV